MLTQFAIDLTNGRKDTVTIDIPLDVAGGKEPPIDFFICRRKDIKAKYAAFPYM